MLKHLFIKNFALIDVLSLDFSRGFTTITGETGAGKSILLGALRLVLGERADLKALKNSNEKCIIEAHFEISNLGLKDFFIEHDLDYEEQTILRRDILPSGKSRAFVNDVPTTLSVISKLADQLIDVHSQFDSASIISQDFQFAWIDAMAEQTELVKSFRKKLKDYQLISNELAQLEIEQASWLKEKELNEYLFEELDSIPLETLNLDELEDELMQLENAEQTLINLSQMSAIIEDEPGIQLLLNELNSKSKEVSQYFKAGDQIQRSIESIKIELQEIIRNIEFSKDDVEPNPQRLIEVTDQLNTLQQLLQKHRKNSVEELIDLKDEYSEKLSHALESSNNIQKITKEKKALTEELKNISEKLTTGRKKVIPAIEKEVLKSLSAMGMERSKLSIQIQTTDSFNNFGTNKIDFLFSANPGLALQPMEKAASGGERSRLVLAIKKSLSQHRALPTLILDEIDTGVSGKVAKNMGNVMLAMSKELQVISITHLPQVAALGQQHFKVYKTVENGTTKTNVEELNTADRLKEIAQMISGNDISKSALDQAQELMK